MADTRRVIPVCLHTGRMLVFYEGAAQVGGGYLDKDKVWLRDGQYHAFCPRGSGAHNPDNVDIYFFDQPWFNLAMQAMYSKGVRFVEKEVWQFDTAFPSLKDRAEDLLMFRPPAHVLPVVLDGSGGTAYCVLREDDGSPVFALNTVEMLNITALEGGPGASVRIFDALYLDNVLDAFTPADQKRLGKLAWQTFCAHIPLGVQNLLRGVTPTGTLDRTLKYAGQRVQPRNSYELPPPPSSRQPSAASSRQSSSSSSSSSSMGIARSQNLAQYFGATSPSPSPSQSRSTSFIPGTPSQSRSTSSFSEMFDN